MTHTLQDQPLSETAQPGTEVMGRLTPIPSELRTAGQRSASPSGSGGGSGYGVERYSEKDQLTVPAMVGGSNARQSSPLQQQFGASGAEEYQMESTRAEARSARGEYDEKSGL